MDPTAVPISVLRSEEFRQRFAHLLNCVELLASEPVFQGTEEVVVAWREVRAVRRMLQTLSAHVFDLLKRLACGVGFCVVLKEDHWDSAVAKLSADALQLIAIEVGVDGLALFQQLPVDSAAPV